MKQNRTILFFSIIMLFALLGSTLIAMFSIRRISKEYATERLSALSKDMERSIDDALSQTIHVSRTIANDTFLTALLEQENDTDSKATEEQIAAYTRRLEDTFSYQWVFIASEASKAYYSSTGIYQILDPTTEEDSWYQEFVDQNREYDVSIGIDNDSVDEENAATIFIDMRIENEEGKLLGVCGVAVRMDHLQTLIRDYEDEYGIDVLFVDENKEIQLEGEDTKKEDLKLDALDLDEIGMGKTIVNRNGLESNYTIAKYVDELGWYMIIRDYNPYHHTLDLFLILLSALSSILVIVLAVLCLRKIMQRNEALYTTSYKDEMTGLYNRRAYEDKRRELRKCKTMDKYTVFVFDVNGLKVANDTLGHFAGDELIKGAAHVIQEVFGTCGQCFRTGGDEFVAILEGERIDVRYLAERFDKRTAEWAGEFVKTLSVSYGAVSGTQNADWTVDDLTTLADEKMYWQKRNFYKKADRDRRRA